MPLINHVPVSAPTKRSIKIAPVTEYKFFPIFFIISLKFILLINPIKTATEAPINKIN